MQAHTASRSSSIYITSGTKKRRARQAKNTNGARAKEVAVKAEHVERAITPMITPPELNDGDDWLRYREAARLIGVTSGTLTVWVCTGRYGVPFYKAGRNVQFKRSELLSWLATRRRGAPQFVLSTAGAR